MRNKFEKKIAKKLKDSGVEFEYEKESLNYTVPEKSRRYTPDFFLKNGIIIEAKGRWTVHDRQKMLLIKEQFPELDIRMLFQYDNFIRKGSKTRYSAWCEKKGIPYAIGEIPEEWLE